MAEVAVQILQITQNVAELKGPFADVLQLAKRVDDLQTELRVEQERRIYAETEREMLRAKVDEMTARLQSSVVSTESSSPPLERRTTPSPPPPPTRRLVIGTSLVKHLTSIVPEDVDVSTYPGASLSQLTEKLASIETRYKDVYVVGGTIELSDATEEETLSRFLNTIDAAKRVSNCVHIASIIPRCDIDCRVKHEVKNNELKSICSSNNVLFIDNDCSFLLRDGSINYAFLHDDGIHLRRAGTEALAVNLQLIPPRDQRSTTAPQAPEQPGDCIKFRGFKSPYSNFYPAPMVYAGQRFHTSEAAYQHSKATFHGEKEKAIDIAASRTGIRAKWLGASVPNSAEWKHHKPEVMTEIIKAKICYNADLRKELINSGSKKLIENVKSDQFWGIGQSGQGQNLVGQILEKHRAAMVSNPSLYPELRPPVLHASSPRRYVTPVRAHSARAAPCANCGEYSHVTTACRHTRNVHCYECLSPTHKRNRCPRLGLA